MNIRVIGVDAHPLGWVGIQLHDGGFVRAVLASTLYDILAASSGAAVIGVAVPLGLLPDRFRTADTLAAAQLGPRRGSIRAVPPHPVWQEADFAAADKRCRELTGQRLTRQTWMLRSKLLQANAIGDRHPGLLFEAHPEVSFLAMAGAPLPYAKQTWTGQSMRRMLLTDNGIVLPEQIGPAGLTPPDDILDAAAVAWSAHRKATGAALSYPSPPEEHDGSQIAIWY